MPKTTVSGLYFTINRPEMHFSRDFMIIWLSVELAGRAKIWGSHPYFRYWTSFFPEEHTSKTNISINFPSSGFTLLEDNQICTFYVILWEDVDFSEKTLTSCIFLFFSLTSNKRFSVNFLIQKKPKIGPESHNFSQCS